MHEYDGGSPPAADELDLAAEVFRMLADPTRLALLWQLQAGEQAVGDLVESLAKPQAAVSQHLAKLRMARLVQTRRQGNQVFYRLANEHVNHLVVDGLFHAEQLLIPGPPDHRGTAVTPSHRPGPAQGSAQGSGERPGSQRSSQGGQHGRRRHPPARHEPPVPESQGQ
ncbi:metalloregulator ArsR/SmtB family transcription factor [Nocardioides sp. 31GB23]|uniref:ArsR/SmtB family transcription factor n=1 Tax=Nocardioides sp. 31GB23 TaxID=3156065 RepID=UPI0032B0094E